MGIPPFVGFFLKIPLISLILSKQIFFLSALFLFSNLLNLFMYLRGVNYLIFGIYESKYWSLLSNKLDKSNKLFLSMNGIQGVLLILYPMVLLGVIDIFT